MYSCRMVLFNYFWVCNVKQLLTIFQINNDFFMTSLKVGQKVFENIKNVIFDLGGVIIDIDYNATVNGFRKLGVTNIDEIFSNKKQTQLFDYYDKGLITPSQFRQGLRDLACLNISDKDIDKAWNAMLFDLKISRVETLRRMKQKYRTFLLSNTNESHLEYFFNRIDTNFGIKNFSELFETAYYSCRLGMRKPDPEIFNKVLELSNLKANETLFLEDLPHNIAGASSVGIQTFQINPGVDDISVLLKDNF